MVWRNDRGYVKHREALRRQVAKTGAPCHICGHPIDTTLPWKHPMSFTADHLIPIAGGGRIGGPLAPAHRACNSRRGAKPLVGLKKPTIPRNSRNW